MTKTYLKDILAQYAEKPSENSEDDDEQDVTPFHFRKSFRMASFLQNGSVFNELKISFMCCTRLLLAMCKAMIKF